MHAVMKRYRAALWAAGAMVMVFAGAPASGQQPAYKCGPHSYSDRPCAGGREVGLPSRHRGDQWKTPPQDRAVIARRAPLSAQDRQECVGLDARLAQEQAQLKTKGPAATLQDEMPLVQAKKRFRELRC